MNYLALSRRKKEKKGEESSTTRGGTEARIPNVNIFIPGVTFVAMSKILSSFVESFGPPAEAAGAGGGGGFAGGASESPSTMFTRQYSINAMNTKIVHIDIKASTALRYETGGNDAWLFACWVESVSNEVTPKVTRAGAASGFIQKDTHWKAHFFINVNVNTQNNQQLLSVQPTEFYEIQLLTDMMTIRQVGTYVWKR